MQSTSREVFALGFARGVHVLYIAPVTCCFKNFFHLEEPAGPQCATTLDDSSMELL